MTNEQAIKHLEVIKGDCALVGDIRALDMGISALSADGEYIKKEDAINSTYFAPTYYDPLNVLTEARDKIKELRTYSFPNSAETETALPEEGAELIDRRQIKWYGCDHEGHIKGINCETADCSKCFHATVEHDEVMSLPVYRIPDSADIEKIRAEIAEIPNKYPMTADYENGIREALSIIDKHIGGK